MKKKSIDYLAKLAEHIKNNYANGTIIQDTANYIHNIVTDIEAKHNYSGDATYKLDIFGNSIVVKMLYEYNHSNSFESTYVYHIDFDVDNSIKEYVVVKFDFTGDDKINNRRYRGYFIDTVLAIIYMSLGFRSTMFEDIGDNTKYAMKWADNNIDRLFTTKDKEDQIYTIVSQTEKYTLFLLITKDSAIIYSLPTKTLSNSETHIEEILCLKHLQENLSTSSTDYQWRTDICLD